MKIYLAGPIDLDESGEDWRSILKDRLNQEDVIIFDPMLPYTFKNVNSNTAEYIHDINMAALDSADIMLVRWMKDQVSVGVPIELYYAAKKSKIPIFMITDMANKSIYIDYSLNMSPRYCVEKDLDKVTHDRLKYFLSEDYIDINKFKDSIDCGLRRKINTNFSNSKISGDINNDH